MFFVIAGANLDLGVLKSSILIVVAFVILRTSGKFLGTFIGATIGKAPKIVKKYVAFGLLPQGGIVVGLALLIKQDPRFNEISSILLNIILGTTVIHEFAGPLFAELALKKAKEIKSL